MRNHLRTIAVGTTIVLMALACAPAPTGFNSGEPQGPPLPFEIPPEGPALRPLEVSSGLASPTNIEFAPNGRVWVAEHSGRVLTFDSVNDTTPTLTIDIRNSVRAWGDHGLLGMAIDPQFPVRPYLYLQYATDPTGTRGDGRPVSTYRDGCLTGARLERLTLDANGVATGQRTTLADNRWCYQFSSHAIGDLKFLPDGTLLSGSGEGASWSDTDYGQKGGTATGAGATPANPCGDPPGAVGVRGVVPTSEGGSLRAQDLLTPGDPLGWNGAIVRLDPDTGAAAADNPLVGGITPDDDHIVAHGLRNPYRFAVDPASGDVLVADVGWTAYEEINRFNVHADTVPNFGWPCEEGPHAQVAWSALKMDMCARAASPTAPSTLTKPWLPFWHKRSGAALSGIEVIRPGRYPSSYDHAVAFADYVTERVYVSTPHADGTAEPTEARVVADGLIAIDLEQGPDGYLYVVDIAAGSVSRLIDASTIPVAQLTASAVDGPLPLTVTFDGSGSVDPTGHGLTFEWDLDGDGQHDDATGPNAARTYATPTNVTVGLQVRTTDGATDDDSVTLYPGNTAPQATIDVTSPLPWSAHDDIGFTITATDADQGTLSASAVSWYTQLVHCYTLDDCHDHPAGDATGSLSGSVEGPSHSYPSFLRVTAFATDTRGETTVVSRQLEPAVARLHVSSNVWGTVVAIDSETHALPYDIDMIKGSDVTVSVVSPQFINGFSHVFRSWSDGGARSHSVVVDADKTIVAQMTLG